MNSKHKIILGIALSGILAAMSAILYVFPTFPILPLFPWLEIDFADIPALLVSTLINPIFGGITVVIRTIVHLPMSTTGGVGELSNCIISSFFVISAGVIVKIMGRKKELSLLKVIVAMLCAMLVQVTVATLCNKFIMIPLYGIKGSPSEYILMGVVPFNFIKTAISSTVFVLVYKLLIPKIKRYI